MGAAVGCVESCAQPHRMHLPLRVARLLVEHPIERVLCALRLGLEAGDVLHLGLESSQRLLLCWVHRPRWASTLSRSSTSPNFASMSKRLSKSATDAPLEREHARRRRRMRGAANTSKLRA